MRGVPKESRVPLLFPHSTTSFSLLLLLSHLQEAVEVPVVNVVKDNAVGHDIVALVGLLQRADLVQHKLVVQIAEKLRDVGRPEAIKHTVTLVPPRIGSLAKERGGVWWWGALCKEQRGDQEKNQESSRLPTFSPDSFLPGSWHHAPVDLQS